MYSDLVRRRTPGGLSTHLKDYNCRSVNSFRDHETGKQLTSDRGQLCLVHVVKVDRKPHRLGVWGLVRWRGG